MENLVTITLRGTHYYLIDAGNGKFMVDTGWAGSLPALQSQLKHYGIGLAQIRYLMITHHHPDHAGLTQELKQAAHARLVILERQIPFLDQLEAFYEKRGGFLPVRVDTNDLVLCEGNRAALSELGICGEIVETPGHSDDSISLVLESGKVFTGDLHPPALVPEETRETTRQSWEKLLRLQAKTVFPAHADPFPIETILKQLEEE